MVAQPSTSEPTTSSTTHHLSSLFLPSVAKAAPAPGSPTVANAPTFNELAYPSKAITVTGKVVNECSGEPIEGATVRMIATDSYDGDVYGDGIYGSPGSSLGVVETDKNGNFTAVADWDFVIDQRITLEISKTKYAPLLRISGNPYDVGNMWPGDESNLSSPIELGPQRLEIKGTVLDALSERPVSGAKVDLEIEDNQEPILGPVEVGGGWWTNYYHRLSTTTNSQGHYSFAVDVGDGFSHYTHLTFSKDGYETSGRNWLAYPQCTPIERNVELGPTFLLKGTAVDADTGDPIDTELSISAYKSMLDSPISVGGYYSFDLGETGEFSYTLRYREYLDHDYRLQFSVDGYALQFYVEGQPGVRDFDDASSVKAEKLGTIDLGNVKLVKGVPIVAELTSAVDSEEIKFTHGFDAKVYDESDFYGGNLWLRPQNEWDYDARDYVNKKNYYTSTQRLLPGNYKLFFTGISAYYSRYSGNKNRLSEAELVEVKKGVERTIVPVSIYPYSHILGSLSDAKTGDVLKAEERGTDAEFDVDFYDPSSGKDMGLSVKGEYRYGSGWNSYRYGGSEIDSSGQYTLTVEDDRVLTTENFFMRFGSPSGRKLFGGIYQPNWYDNKDTIKDANTLTIEPGKDVTYNVEYKRGAVVGGKVVDAEDPDNPIDGVEVVLRTAGTNVHVGSRYTGETGTYSFTNVAAGNYTLEFYGAVGEAQDYASEYYDNQDRVELADIIEVSQGEEKTIPTVDLEKKDVRDLTVQLTYQDQDIVSMPEVDVSLFNARTGEVVWGYNDRYFDPDYNAVFTVTNVAPGVYKMFVEADGYQPQWYDGVLGSTKDDGFIAQATEIDLTEDDKEITMALVGEQRGIGTLSGQVRMDDNGDPLGNTEVRLLDAFTGDEVQDTRTSEDGRYEFTNIMTGEYKVQFMGDNAYYREYYNDKQRKGDAQVFGIFDSTPMRSIDASLGRGGYILLTVVASDTNKAIAGMYWDNIWAVNAKTGEKYRPDTRTDASGMTTISGLPPGDYMIETRAFGEYRPYEEKATYKVEAQKRTEVTIGLARGNRLIGQVFDAETDQPIWGAEVQLHYSNFERPVENVSSAYTANEGYYIFEGIEDGTYKVSASESHYHEGFHEKAETWEDGKPVTVKNSTQSDVDIYLKLDEPGTINGRVTLAPHGLPAKNVKVFVYDARTDGRLAYAITDKNGLYSVSSTSIASGTYLVEFRPPPGTDYATEWYDNQESRRDATEISLIPGKVVNADAVLEKAPGVVVGRITAADTGFILNDVNVHIYRADTGDEVAMGHTEYDGTYRVTGLVSTTYKVFAGGIDDYASQWWSGKDTFKEGDPLTFVGGTAPVTDTEPITDTNPTTPTLMTVFAQPFADISATDRMTATADFTLDKAGIKGHITNQDGVPMVGTNLVFSGPSHSTSPVVVKEDDGSYEVIGLQPGMYEIQATPSKDYRKKFKVATTWYGDTTNSEWAAEVKVSSMGFATADIILQPGATLKGHVMGDPNATTTPTTPTLAAEMQGLPDVLVKAYGGVSYMSLEALSGSDGSYQFEEVLDPGFYTFYSQTPRKGIASIFPDQYFDRVTSSEMATAVELKGGENTLDIPLSEEPAELPARLAGTVYYDETGAATFGSTADVSGTVVADANVDLYRITRDGLSLEKWAKTDAQGKFEIADIKPGEYKVSVRPPMEGTARNAPTQWVGANGTVKRADQALRVMLHGGKKTMLDINLLGEPLDLYVTPDGTGTVPVCNTDRSICLDFPALAVSNVVNLSLSKVASDAIQASKPYTGPIAFYFTLKAYMAETGGEVTSTSKAYTVTLTYTDEELKGPPSVGENGLVVYFWDEDSGEWVNPTVAPWCTSSECGQTVDKVNNKIYLHLDHFSEYVASSEDSWSGYLYLPLISTQKTTSVSSTMSLQLP